MGSLALPDLSNDLNVEIEDEKKKVVLILDLSKLLSEGEVSDLAQAAQNGRKAQDADYADDAAAAAGKE